MPQATIDVYLNDHLAKAGASIADTKFSGESMDDPRFGTFLTLETLSIGIEGKLCMWNALKVVEGNYPQIAALPVDTLIGRAQPQRDSIEAKRLELASSALSVKTADV